MKTTFEILRVSALLLTSNLVASADEIHLNAFQAGSDPVFTFNQTGPSPLSVSHSAAYGSLSGSSAFGRLELSLSGVGTANNNAYVSVNGYWLDTYTISPSDPALNGTAATALFTFTATGSQTAVNIMGRNDFTISINDNVVYDGQYKVGVPFAGTHIEEVGTFTFPVSFVFGSPFTLNTRLSGLVDNGSGADSTASLHVLLRAGGMSVTNNSGSVGYSSASSLGSARGSVFTSGSDLTGFGLTNSTGHQTQLTVLAGSAGSSGLVMAGFVANPATNTLASDVVNFSGTGTNLVVLQLSYDPATAISLFGGELGAALVWFDQASASWVNAIQGNSDHGARQQHFTGPFDPKTLLQLGNYGVDTLRHVVWAVLDHNSVFGVGQVAQPVVLRWSDVRLTAQGSLALILKGQANTQYTVEFTTNLSGTNWTPLGTLLLDTNGMGTFTDNSTVSTNGQRFYRARQ